MGDVIQMPPPNQVRPDKLPEIEDFAWAKLRISKIVWDLPTEEALGILADMAIRLLRRTYDGETAKQSRQNILQRGDLCTRESDRPVW